MRTRRFLPLCLSILMSTSAWALPAGLEQLLASSRGGISDGGGNAVVCFDNLEIPQAIRTPMTHRTGMILDSEIAHITSIEAIDLYEARMSTGLGGRPNEVIEILPAEGPREYTERVARRFEFQVPRVSEIIRWGAREFPESQIIVRPSGLTRVSDENDVGYIDSTRCVVATIATQFTYGDGSRALSFLHLDQRLFFHPSHGALSQAVLFLHEAIYAYQRINYLISDSRPTRTLVRKLISREVGLVEVNQLLASLHLQLDYGCLDLDGFNKQHCHHFVARWIHPVISAITNEARVLAESPKRSHSAYRSLEERFLAWNKAYLGKKMDYGTPIGHLSHLDEQEIRKACDSKPKKAADCLNQIQTLKNELRNASTALQSEVDQLLRSRWAELSVRDPIFQQRLTEAERNQLRTLVNSYFARLRVQVANWNSHVFYLDNAHESSEATKDLFRSISLLDVAIP